MPVKNTRVSQAVAKAVELNRTIKTLQADLEGLKAVIRGEAEKLSKDGELVEFDSPEGVATVCFYKDGAAAVEGANLWELKDSLPEVTWNDLFVEKVGLASGFNEKFAELRKRFQRILGEYIEWKPRAPHVILPK